MQKRKLWMSLCGSMLLSGVFLLASNAYAAPDFVNAADPDLPEKARGIPKGGALRVSGLMLDTLGEVTLDLERFTVFSPDTKIEVVGGPAVNVPDVAYFRGAVADTPGSSVMMAVPKNGKVRGVVSSKSGSWMMESGAGSSGLKNRKVDLAKELAGRTFECGVDSTTFTPDNNNLAAANEAAAAGLPLNVQYTAHMIIDTDYEYWEQFWNRYSPDVNETAAKAIEYIGDLVAYTSIAYEREINTNLLIQQVRLFADNSDPYSAPGTGCGGDPGFLPELQAAWMIDFTPRTLVHGLSGRPGGGCGFYGENYSSVLCSTALGYAVSMGIGTGFDIDNPGFLWEGHVMAHEIGHNFGSRHTHEYCDLYGIASPVDACADSCLPNDGTDPYPVLPGLGSLTGGTDGDQNGTIMSYCKSVGSGFLSNVAHTFGEFHPYGVAAWRVPEWMRTMTAAHASCMTVEYTGSDLQVFKDCKPDDPMLVGDTAVCTITVQNYGPDTALGVTAVDEYVSDGIFSFGAITVSKGANTFYDLCSTTTNPQDQAGTVTCDLGFIDSGHSAVIKIPVTADEPQNINDRVAVSSDSPDTDMSNNSAEDEVNVMEIADLEVFKDCKPDDPMLAGQTGTCTITVKNWGPSIAENVTLHDRHISTSNGTFNFGNVNSSQGSCTTTSNPQVGSGDVNCNLGDLLSGAEATVTVDLLTDEGQNINDTVIVSSDSYDPDSTNNSASDGVGVEPVADLVLSKTASLATVTAGTQLTYNLEVTNLGPSQAVNVVIEDVLPAGVTIDSVSSPDGTCNAGVPGDGTLPTTCTVDSLAVGGSANMEVVVTVEPQTLGILGNNAKAYSDLFDLDNSNNLATTATNVEASADLSVTKSDHPDPVLAGEYLTYDVTIRNNGPSTAVDVMLSDELPDEVTFDGYIVSNGSGTCVPLEGSTTVECDLNDLNPGESVTVFIKVLVDPAVPDGSSISETATVSSGTPDPDNSNNSVTEETLVNAEADLWIDKTGNFPTGNPSGTILYYLTVYNQEGCSEDDPQVCGSGGPSDAQNVVVIDHLPEPRKKINVEFVSEKCSYDETAHTVTCTEPVLPYSSKVTFEVQISVKGGVGEITNVAEVSSTTVDPNSNNNTDELLMTVQGGTGDTGGPSGGRGRGPKK